MADTTPSPLPPGESPNGTIIVADVPPSLQPSSPPKISLRSPLKYALLPSSSNFQAPPLEWLQGTWSVTHSTLPMWRKAKNVRITYKIIPPSNPGAPTLLDDEVRSEPTQKTWMPQPKSIRGIDTPCGGLEEGAWNWRGRGWLRVASSHWEVLGSGESDREVDGEKERWVVTWFAPSLFTPAGLDIYSSRKEGMSEGLYESIRGALEGLEVREVAELCKNEMREVRIEY